MNKHCAHVLRNEFTAARGAVRGAWQLLKDDPLTEKERAGLALLVEARKHLESVGRLLADCPVQETCCLGHSLTRE